MLCGVHLFCFDLHVDRQTNGYYSLLLLYMTNIFFIVRFIVRYLIFAFTEALYIFFILNILACIYRALLQYFSHVSLCLCL